MASGSIQLVERRPTVEEYSGLTAAAGWKPRDAGVIAAALAGSIFAVCAELGGGVVAMGRVIGDGGLGYFLTDVVVAPEHQRQGLGSRVVQMLTTRLEAVPLENAWVGVSPAPGTAEFYARFGYQAQRPSGPAMYRWLNRRS